LAQVVLVLQLLRLVLMAVQVFTEWCWLVAVVADKTAQMAVVLVEQRHQLRLDNQLFPIQAHQQQPQ
jgi:hypothetical protein